jgi:lipopolysaccharide export system protein LptA
LKPAQPRLTIARSRFTIERLRTLVLIGGLLLLAAIVISLVGGQWARRFLKKDLPNRLGINIQQQADGINYTQSRKGKIIFKLHAAREQKLKLNGETLLHDVRIDLYGEDGNRADTISGSEFHYDPNLGLATAAGAVEITMMRPGVKPAITELKPGSAKASQAKVPPQAKAPPLNSALNSAANEITDGQIHVKTSGLTFNQRTSVATTAQRVDFALQQGSGNSIGATYDSTHGQLILDHAVELHVQRAGGEVIVHATHAEFERSEQQCRLTQAKADYSGGAAQSANALIHFRADGSVAQLDGSGGVDLQTKSGGHVTAPLGTLDFDEKNHPRHGLLQGGARLDMNLPNRQVQGSSPTAQLTFDSQGQLSQAHMEQGVVFNTQQQVTTAKGASSEVSRTWKSQTADVAFAPASAGGKTGATQNSRSASAHNHPPSRIEPRTIHGYGGVTVTSETKAGSIVTPSRLAADTVVAELAPGGSLSSLSGAGHASFDERTAQGSYQSSTADQLDIRFLPASSVSGDFAKAAPVSRSSAEGSQIASITEIGHVILIQNQPNRPGTVQPAFAQPAPFPPGNQTGLRATANRADYDGQTQIMHLSGSPRVRDGALDLTSNTVDFNRATSDAFAHGDVRASWIGASGTASPMPGSSLLGSGASTGKSPSGDDPVHAIAAEAELRQTTQEVTFHGSGAHQPRLWQSANSVSAPTITLNRQKQTLTAEAKGPSDPVRTTLLSNPPKKPATQTGSQSGSSAANSGKSQTPSVIRLRSGDLHYSEGERLALFHSGSVGSVTAETTETGGSATIVSQEAEVRLEPAGSRSSPQSEPSGQPGPAPRQASSSSIDQLIAHNHVTVNWPDRKGTGEKLVYLSDDGTFTLTGSSTAPPRITDQARGSVTGNALIFHSRDDSVTVEGDGAKTATETQSPK